jgi:hypothetical protein
MAMINDGRDEKESIPVGESFTVYFATFCYKKVKGFPTWNTEIRMVSVIITELGKDPLTADQMWRMCMAKSFDEWDALFPDEPIEKNGWDLAMKTAKLFVFVPHKEED